ncbi:MAG: hypothetical protein HOO94_00855 [Novosphingobium sp.]|uniref:hypothetical protein n=1 Tax=Novosphingobium sp. TaxID=1874826 RepID=UPI0018462388|nr:hypothetical protein [Novosphingobium sp.]
MTEAERRLMEDRSTRNAARGVFDTNLAQVKADLEARSIPGRIADKADREVREAIAAGLDVASESKGIIAGTLAALVLWFFREPVLAQLKHLFTQAEPARVQDDGANNGDEHS